MSDSLFLFDRGQNTRYVCGADEAGRACMAGPLVAAKARPWYAQAGCATCPIAHSRSISRKRARRFVAYGGGDLAGRRASQALVAELTVRTVLGDRPNTSRTPLRILGLLAVLPSP